ncbi:MAG: WbqC family protein [Bacteroidetes bacterium]|nr:WbqC family protein [Bacteroidota bacterium]
MNLISEIQYFPSLIFYKNSFHCTNIVFEQYETYQKMSFRNRTMIAGANGIIELSVPLARGRNQKGLTKDVRIDNRQKWQMRHWRSIESSYNHSPWFQFYVDDLTALYKKPFDFLIDWNLACFEWTTRILNWPVKISLSDVFHKKYEVRKWSDQRNNLLPKNYMYHDPVKYRQVFEDRNGFIPNLSILDLLCCEGKRAAILLK